MPRPADHDDPAAVVGARIAQVRRERGLTQRELAENLGVTVRSIQSYEAGAVVPYRHLPRLAAHLHRSPTWFLHGRDRGMEEREALVALRQEFRDRVRTLEEQLAQLAERLEQLRSLTGDTGNPPPPRRGKPG